MLAESEAWVKVEWERPFNFIGDLFKEYQSINALNKHLRTDREFLAKMLTRGKISKGISLEDWLRIIIGTKLGPMVGIGVNEETYAQP